MFSEAEQTGKAVFPTVYGLDCMKREADLIVATRDSMVSIAENVTG
jgi:hypothetical protein